MRLPNVINEKLAGKANLLALVNHAIAATANVHSTRPEFFPEYTDHSIKHNEDVLETAVSLLTDATLSILTPSDCACLTLSVLLHDIGMHLTGAGFAQIIEPQHGNITSVDRSGWSDLWSDFLFEAKRFDGPQLIRLFGESTPISVPSKNPAEHTHKDKLLIGEFIRRHHPRLAHEVAIYGFPGTDNKRISILQGDSSDLNELAGLIARSHGEDMRSAIDRLRESRFHHREYQGIHPPILMAALRIADYLQIQSERAPRGYLSLNKITSPFSQMEWTLHHAVRNVTRAHDDPEAIYVFAEPKDVRTYLKFTSWSSSLQAELDATWAVLGEVYGRFKSERFDELGLRLRRIRTNTDHQQEFANSVSYFPAKVSFDTSSADLLSLLVAPLYGDKPQIGLRELIQNATDAVIERISIEGCEPTSLVAGFDADVVIYPVLDDGIVTQVVVADRGIGMNVEIINNYFLRAGASFRTSSAWKRAFTDDAGHSTITRSGRFGIGALAAFLIGDKLSVETRRYDEPRGVRFIAALDTDLIEITTGVDTPIGTHLTISVPEEKRAVVTLLFAKTDHMEDWDWFCYRKPTVLRLDQSLTPIPSKFIFEQTTEWVALPTDRYDQVYWKSPEPSNSKWGASWDDTSIYCNGIEIRGMHYRGDSPDLLPESHISTNFEAILPHLIISDKDGLLPLNLQRDGFATPDADLNKALLRSLCDDLVAEALAKAPEQDPFRTVFPYLSKCQLTCDWRSQPYYGNQGPLHWSWHNSRWMPSDLFFSNGCEWLCIFFGDINLAGLKDDVLTQSKTQLGWHDIDWSADNQEHCRDFVSKFDAGGRLRPDRRQVVCFSNKVLEKLRSRYIPQYIEKRLTSELKPLGTGYVLADAVGVSHPVIENLREVLERVQVPDFCFLMTESVKKDASIVPNFFEESWQRFIGTQAIPLSFEERRIAFPKAFDEMGARIAFHRRRSGFS